MVDFVCRDPKAEVRAANVRATLQAFSLVPSMGARLIARHQLDLQNLTPDNFVPVQRWLNALKEIQAVVGGNVVRQLGARIIENADFPPAYPTVESILLGLDAIYHHNHRGEVGHYHCVREGRTIVIRCETPYPRQFELGLVEGICRNRYASACPFTIEYADGPLGEDLTCTISVNLE